MFASLSHRPGAGAGYRFGASQDHRHEARAVLGTAAPVAAMALVNMAMSVTDTLMAAAAVGNEVYSLAFYLVIGILGGLTPSMPPRMRQRTTRRCGACARPVGLSRPPSPCPPWPLCGRRTGSASSASGRSFRTLAKATRAPWR